MEQSAIQDQINALPESSVLKAGFVAPLPHLGLLQFSGDDAISLLDRLLTNELTRLPNTSACLTGLCTPKGRLIASFLAWKSNGNVILQCEKAIQSTVENRLKMYVLRDKVTITDLNSDTALIGLGGEACETPLKTLFPELPSTPYACIQNDYGTLIRMSDVFGSPRYQWIGETEKQAEYLAIWGRDLPLTNEKTWQMSEIEAGIPQITQETQEFFVPQMINYELIGGVNFKKGCYIGQEIVARTQYLGKSKRRMLLADLSADTNITPHDGQDVFADENEHASGKIVNVQKTRQGFVCLLSLPTDIAANSRITLGENHHAAFAFRPLPYALPE